MTGKSNLNTGHGVDFDIEFDVGLDLTSRSCRVTDRLCHFRKTRYRPDRVLNCLMQGQVERGGHRALKIHVGQVAPWSRAKSTWI